MLVYYYLPKGYAYLNGKQIHGSEVGKPPIRINWKEYDLNKEILIQAPFTPDYIENATNKTGFPYRAYFTLDMIRNIPYRKLQQIATYFDVENAKLENIRLIYSVRNRMKDL